MGYPLRELAAVMEEIANTVNSGDDLELAAFADACSYVSPLFDCLHSVLDNFFDPARDYADKVEELKAISDQYQTIQDLHNSGDYTDCLLIVNRNLDMIRVFFEGILKEPGEDDLRAAFKDAYDQVFEPHHDWVTRQAAYARISLLPDKPSILQDMNETEDTYADPLGSYIDSAAVVVGYINEIYFPNQSESD